MQTTINGTAFTFDVYPDEAAVELLRERAHLTGTKLVCGAGVCGACTVLLDGMPVTSCLLPAHALEGRSVQTIEHFGPELHPVQRAFMACDALQCGFCTPGFVIEGIAFYERWRKEHGAATPSREEVAGALAGHLCRCGAYPGIYVAIQAACAGAYDANTGAPPRLEAAAKVTGCAKYTVDIVYDGQLEGRILRSSHPHAKIRTIDSSAALAIDGVKAVVELLDKKRTVRYVGQEILAVAAVDRRTADAALAQIKVEYELLPAVIGMAAARADDAPAVYSGFKKDPPNAGEGMLLPGAWQHNVRKSMLAITAHQAAKARNLIATARQNNDPYLVEGVWVTESQSHTVLEPHACVAKWEADRVVVHASTQSCHRLAREIADHFDLPDDRVHVLCEHIGGAFGSKLEMTMETVAAVSLSRAAGAPVRVVLDRLEELTVGGYRPAAEISLALLAAPDGEMQALSSHVYADAGIAIGSQIAVLMGLIYDQSPRDLVDYDVVNHAAPGKPFRGPGGPLACWAQEQAVDEMAHKLAIDPIALRRRWDRNELRHKLYDWAAELPVWRERGPVGGDKGRFRRGVGLAAANWFYFFHSATTVEVAATAEGIVVTTSTQDMGNGSRSVIAHAVEEVFGIPHNDVIVLIGDSRAPRGPLSGGSRTTNSLFSPTRRAANQVRQQLLEAATKQFDLRDAKAVPGGIEHAGGHLPWPEVWKVVPRQAATVRRGLDHGLPAMPLAFGADDLNTGRGFTGAIHISEIEVDTRLGKIRPLRVWGGFAVGRIIAPVLARSQCYGGVIQGMGYALYEERQLDQVTGHTLSMGLEDYRIPGIGDIPEIDIHFIEEGFDHARGQGVGLSELSTLAVAASIGNAVFHATGWRPYRLPIHPAHIIEGVRA
jgi:xanthine dehydrogenase YagR molybdenum-binding subunit